MVLSNLMFVPLGHLVGSEGKHDLSGVTTSSSRPLDQLQIEPSTVNMVIIYVCASYV